jgi:hypothetical protein
MSIAINNGGLASSATLVGGGDASGAKQDTGNTSLGSIDGKLATLGQKAMAGSVPVTLANNQSAVPVTLPAGASDGDGHLQVDVLSGGGGSLADGADFTADVTQAVPIQGLYQSVHSDATDGDLAVVRVTQDRCLLVKAADASGDPVNAIADPADNSAFTAGTTPVVPIAALYDNNESDTVTDGRVAAVGMTTTRHLKAQVDGDVAHGAAASTSNPVKVGGVTAYTLPILLDSGDTAQALMDGDGAFVGRPGLLRDWIKSDVKDLSAGSEVSCLAAGAAGVYTYVTGYSVVNTSATTVYVDILDGSPGTVMWRVIVPAGGGANLSGLSLKGTAATAVYADASAAQNNVYICLNAYRSKV